MKCAKDEAERFWSHVDQSGGPDACWPWTAALGQRGYGQFARKTPHGPYSPVLAHRFAYQITKGEIPAGMEILHECDFRPCNNPDHLTAGTHYQNMLDAAQKGRTSQKWLSPDAVCEIRELIAIGIPLTTIAEQFSVTARAISYIRTGQRHAHAPLATNEATRAA